MLSDKFFWLLQICNGRYLKIHLLSELLVLHMQKLPHIVYIQIFMIFIHQGDTKKSGKLRKKYTKELLYKIWIFFFIAYFSSLHIFLIVLYVQNNISSKTDWGRIIYSHMNLRP